MQAQLLALHLAEALAGVPLNEALGVAEAARVAVVLLRRQNHRCQALWAHHQLQLAVPARTRAAVMTTSLQRARGALSTDTKCLRAGRSTSIHTCIQLRSMSM